MLIAPKAKETKLLSMVANGDREAFAQLYSGYLDSIYKYIQLITKSKEETEEILQEVFIKIWENRATLKNVDSFKSYLFRCAKNKMLDNVRHQQVKRRAIMEISRLQESFATTTADESAYKEYYDLVQQAIEKLPPQRKLIFRLTTEKGFSRAEIASHLKISNSVVSKQIYKASHFVRGYLAKNGEITIPVLLLLILRVTLK